MPGIPLWIFRIEILVRVIAVQAVAQRQTQSLWMVSPLEFDDPSFPSNIPHLLQIVSKLLRQTLEFKGVSLSCTARDKHQFGSVREKFVCELLKEFAEIFQGSHWVF